MAEAMFTWGTLSFSGRLPADRLKRRTRYRWPAIDRIGRRPARQSLGPGEDEMTIEAVAYPSYRGSLADLAALRALVLDGDPHLLSSGDGTVYGDWAGMSLDTAAEGLFPDGAPRKVQWTLTLVHYGTDDPAGRATGMEQMAEDSSAVSEAINAVEEAAAAGASAQEIAAAAEEAVEPRVGFLSDQSRQVLDVADQARALATAARRVAAGGGSVADVLRAARGIAARMPGVPSSVVSSGIDVLVGDGDTLSDVGRRVYGAATSKSLSALLELNSGLNSGARLVAGTRVLLPLLDGPTAETSVPKLW